MYRVVHPLGEKLDFFSPWGSEAKSDFDQKTFKLNPQLIRASELYPNDKNPIHGRETAPIFQFSAEVFVFLFPNCKSNKVHLLFHSCLRKTNLCKRYGNKSYISQVIVHSISSKLTPCFFVDFHRF